MLNLDRLRSLQAVAALGSVSGAAAVLHLTPSAVSQHLRKLEQETGHQLVTRTGRGVELTPNARLLAERARHILALVDETEAELQSRNDHPVGRLSLGAFPTAARGVVPRALRILSERAPQLEVRVRELDHDSPLAQVERGELDVGIAQDWEHMPISWTGNLRRRLLMVDTACVALPADHALADRTAVRVSELADASWISRPQRSTCHEWLMHTMREQGAEPRIVHMVAEHPTQIALVSAGVGLAMVPSLGLGHLPKDVVALPVEPSLTRRIYAVWRPEAAVRPSVRVTIEALAEVGSTLHA
ncbi:LysR family transcriptional regulator [Actinoallomurus rhizosphaericola]|uniref:LysR family transcriptional regulator n=1 Tax=Actinoallomurus rhizosphaericola TaxID=2952536 RepID=UPI0020933D85|nr:LysR family transcriptional regulator [Actinoallomurus rhizosphaericola]MCO5995729.1 LysR family transcriptional regulator [Actinoallomurus rhizosphaericola]